MTKHVLSTLAFVAETLIHASVIVENSDASSLWMMGAGFAGVCLASSEIVPHVREALLFNGPPQVDWRHAQSDAN